MAFIGEPEVSQRRMMRQLWQKFGPDKDRVILEYAAAETAGRVVRRSNQTGIPPTEYARRLLADGMMKGWLTREATSGRVGRSESRVSGEFGAKSLTYPPQARRPTQRALRESIVSSGGGISDSEEYLSRVMNWQNSWRPDACAYF